MAKRTIDLTSERPMTGSVRGHQPAVIRVRLYQSRGDKPQYRLDSLLFSVPVPPVLRHLDGRSVRGVLLLVLVVMGVVGYGLVRLLLAEG